MEEKKEINIQPLLDAGWQKFSDIKPPVDELILVTQGGYVEISYYNPSEQDYGNRTLSKAWRFDEYDQSVFDGTEDNIVWKLIFPENYLK